MDQGRSQAGALLPHGAELEAGGQSPATAGKRAGPRRGLPASSHRGRRSHPWAWREDREVASAEPSGGLSQEWGKVPPLCHPDLHGLLGKEAAPRGPECR